MDTPIAEAVFRAYRQGLVRKHRVDASSQRPTFDVILFQILWTRFSPPQRLRFRRIWRMSQRGLMAARNGRLEAAVGHFEQAQQAVERLEESVECRLLARSFLESAHSYFDHREGRFDQARRRTLLAMDCDLTLQNDTLFDILELHRIQAANNLMRVDLRCGLSERGLSLAGRILAYLDGFCDELPVHRTWRPDRLGVTPRSIRKAMVAQVANEAVLGLFRFPGGKAWRAFHDSVEPRRYAAAPCVLHPRFGAWLQLREAFLAGDGRYLGLLHEFLPQGREDVACLWYSSVIDFLELCQRLGTPIAAYVRAAILRDAARWPALPDVFRSCLGLPADPSDTRASRAASVGALGNLERLKPLQGAPAI